MDFFIIYCVLVCVNTVSQHNSDHSFIVFGERLELETSRVVLRLSPYSQRRKEREKCERKEKLID